ncbi:hypothetical protein ACN6LC_005650 [Streptomyces violaceoruber]|uniref:hypothetical protein n=1 Tax=Streptomyces violaceoruber TaxID=1935 RepID=UPI00403C4B46
MEFRTLLSHRAVPWDEVVSVEKRYRTGRNGTWSYVRVLRAHGRALTLPGALKGPNKGVGRGGG